MQVLVTNDAAEIQRLVDQGFCPVECSIDGSSIVDNLTMDHHGELSGLEGVALRAYRDHFGVRRADPRFVIAGHGDADATFAVASLAGLLPHPSREAEAASLPPHLRGSLTRDLTSLAGLVNRVDVDPIGIDLATTEGGDSLLAWQSLTAGQTGTSMGAHMGVGLWVSLAAGHPAIRPLVTAAKACEADRRAAARADLEAVGVVHAGIRCLDGSKVFGFDVWYGRRPEEDASLPSGWESPIVLARSERDSSITVGCPNQAVAEALFGPGGLKNVFPKLDAIAPGWGGREAVGGSPRGQKMTSAQLAEAAQIVADYMLRD